jgi:hypothetical protein
MVSDGFLRILGQNEQKCSLSDTLVVNVLEIACKMLGINALRFRFSKFVDFLFLFFVWSG